MGSSGYKHKNKELNIEPNKEQDNLDYIKEKNLNQHPTSLKNKQFITMFEQMEKSICKIKCSVIGTGTGFFFKIPCYDNSVLLRVLITNNHILGEKDILIGNSINFSLDDEKYEYKIKIDKSRLIYSNVKYDVSIIEIKEKDYLEKNLFLNLDDNILNIDQYQIYKDISIYLLHYPKGENIECSIGVLKNISDDYK